MTTLPEEPAGEVAADAAGELSRLLAVMDTLRSPGGCPWDAAQTHQSLVPYSLEEAYELAEVIEDEDRTGLREELGDLLLQVVFHARIATEHPTDPFGIGEVARGIADKLIRRHPYVFDAETPGLDRPTEAGQTHRIWDQVKAEEKQRASILDGIPRAQPALARSQKVLARAGRAGLLPPWVQSASAAAAPDRDPSVDAEGPSAEPPEDAAILSWDTQHPESSREAIGREILALVLRAQELGVDAESALRHACRELETHIRDRESPGAPA